MASRKSSLYFRDETVVCKYVIFVTDGRTQKRIPSFNVPFVFAKKTLENDQTKLAGWGTSTPIGHVVFTYASCIYILLLNLNDFRFFGKMIFYSCGRFDECDFYHIAIRLPHCDGLLLNNILTISRGTT